MFSKEVCTWQRKQEMWYTGLIPGTILNWVGCWNQGLGYLSAISLCANPWVFVCLCLLVSGCAFCICAGGVDWVKIKFYLLLVAGWRAQAPATVGRDAQTRSWRQSKTRGRWTPSGGGASKKRCWRKGYGPLKASSFYQISLNTNDWLGQRGLKIMCI